MTMAMDVSGHGNNLTSVGSMTHTEEGLQLSLQDAYLLYWEIPQKFVHRLDHDFTIMLWFKPETEGGLFQFANVTALVANDVG